MSRKPLTTEWRWTITAKKDGLQDLIVTGLLIPAIWRWVDQRQKKAPKR